MTRAERVELARRLEREIGPLIEKSKHDGGYDCCGCSTYRSILNHAENLVLGAPLADE
jgi:hypothetical protein